MRGTIFNSKQGNALILIVKPIMETHALNVIDFTPTIRMRVFVSIVMSIVPMFKIIDVLVV